MRNLHPIIIASFLAAAAASSASAQSSPCLTQADSVAEYRLATTLIFKWTDSTTAVAEGRPWASLPNIQVVTDSTVCAAGVAAYNQMAETAGTPEADTAAYILSLGGTGFAYFRVGRQGVGGRRMVFVFTTDWTYKFAVLS